MNPRPSARSPVPPVLQKNESLLSRGSRDVAAAADDIDDLLWVGKGTDGPDPDAAAAGTAVVAGEQCQENM